MVEKVSSTERKRRIAIAWAHDSNTVVAVQKAINDGFAEAVMIGNPTEIKKTCYSAGVNYHGLEIVESDNDAAASAEAVRLVRKGEADIVMKGLVGTDKFLRAVMDKNEGLMLPEAVLSYVCAVEVPDYHKLLFITDPAVIPFPNLDQKVAMAAYAIGMANKFGVAKPKIALIGASEKMSRHFENSTDYAVMCKMADRGHFEDCIMDGPLDLFLACDRQSPGIKGVSTPVNGDADILLFPSLESSNPFYKGLMLFAHGKLAGLIRGTTKPVIVMSRSESELSKYYCIALACLMV